MKIYRKYCFARWRCCWVDAFSLSSFVERIFAQKKTTFFPCFASSGCAHLNDDFLECFSLLLLSVNVVKIYRMWVRWISILFHVKRSHLVFSIFTKSPNNRFYSCTSNSISNLPHYSAPTIINNSVCARASFRLTHWLKLLPILPIAQIYILHKKCIFPCWSFVDV